MQYRVLLPVFTLFLSACGGGGGEEGAAPAARVEYLVSAQASSGGSISPTSANVAAGQTTRFTITPMADFQIGEVRGCDGRLNGQTYTTAAVTANCNVSASFVTKRYQVSTRAGEGGSISPSSKSLAKGTTTTFTITPDSGHTIGTVQGCDGRLEGNTYTTGMIQSDCNVEATFLKKNWTVTLNVGSGGKASTTSQQVPQGTVLSISFTPDPGFELTDAIGCESTLRHLVLETAPISWNCTIEAKFHPSNSVVLADANLAEIVRKALNLAPDQAISKAQAASLQRLAAANSGITSLQGLQHFTGLKYLDLSNNWVTSIYPLQTMRGLEELRFDGNSKVMDLRPLRELKNLKRLTMAKTGATDLSPLQGLPLQILELEHAAALDLTPLTGMPLKQFSLVNSATTDISALAAAPLEKLYLTGSKVSSLAMFTNLSALNYLLANYSDLRDISTLKQAKTLYNVSLDRTKVMDLSDLPNVNFAPNAILSISGCLDLNGYSRHIPVLNDLQANKKIRVDSTGGRRSDCPDSMAGVTLKASGSVSNRQLNYNLEVAGASTPLMCAVYLDLDDQLPNFLTAKWQDCSVSMNKVLPDVLADQFRVAVFFDNGVGGEKLVKFETGAAPATPQLQSMDLNQITLSNKALLTPGRDGLLRLHVTAAQSPATLPQVSVQTSLNGNRQTFTAKAPTQLPTSKVHRSLSDSYQLVIPAAWMQAGLEVTALVDGKVTRTIKPSFASARPLAIRIVPFQLGDKVATLPTTQQVESWVKNYWPFSEVSVRTRAPYVLQTTSSTSSAHKMLAELSDLRRIEGESVYYYGFFSPDMGDKCCSGLGYISFPVAVGFDTDTIGSIFAHELGHNFGRKHVNCGKPDNPDKNYPYADNSTGSVGLTPDFSAVRLPDQYKDLMSYCSPQHVSDYNVEAVQEFVKQHPPAAFGSSAAAAPMHSATAPDQHLSVSRTLYISGNIKNGVLTIRTMMPLNRAPQLSMPGTEAYAEPSLTDAGSTDAKALPQMIAKLQDDQGQWREFAAQLLQIDHASADAGIDFMLEVPYQKVSALQLWQAGRQLASVVSESVNTASNAVAANTTKPSTARLRERAMPAPMNLASAIRVEERSNEVCVRWPSTGAERISILHEVAGDSDTTGITTLALNETAAEFCRPITDISPGGQWRIIWRDKLSVREFVQQR